MRAPLDPVTTRRLRDERDIVIARKMFIAGLFFLPWLWCMCIMKLGVRHAFAVDTHPTLRWSAFVMWVALFQQLWRSWGAFGSDLLIYQPDKRWWIS